MLRARTVRIANPARRYRARRSNPTRRRRLTAAQIAAGFGGKRRQASLLGRPRHKKRNAPRPWKSLYRARYASKRKATGTYARGVMVRNPARRRRRANAGPRSVRRTIKRIKAHSWGSFKPHIGRVRAAYKGLRKKRRRRTNIAELVSIGLGNPAKRRRRSKRGTTMARARRVTRRRRRVNAPHRRRRTRRNFMGFNFSGRRHRRRSRRNPFVARSRRRSTTRRHHRRRNPSFGGTASWLIDGAYVAAGGVVSRVVPNLFLGAKNVGWTGYAANALVAIVGGGVVKRFLGAPQGKLFTLGGFASLVQRIVSENSPTGSFLNAQLAGSGMGDYGMGVYLPTTFFSPLTFSQTDRSIQGQASALLPAAVRQKAMAGLSGRYSGRGRYN